MPFTEHLVEHVPRLVLRLTKLFRKDTVSSLHVQNGSKVQIG